MPTFFKPNFLLVVLGLSFLACAPRVYKMTVEVNPINAYRGYGEYKPDADKAIMAKAEMQIGLGKDSVEFWQETLPAGIENSAQGLRVLPGFGHQLIGKYAFSTGKMTAKTELIAKAKDVAAAAGGDLIIGLFIATDEQNYDNATALEAVIVKKDPRMSEPKPPQPGDEAI